jgi:MerR family transcriptional regulator, light-induced transcriptional regulator
MAHSRTNYAKSPAGHRIGAVSALSGVPVPTLRVWEVRYGTFSPRMTEGRQRIYSDDDVLRATLLKRLTAQGHSIGGIANHDAARLNTLLQQQNTSQPDNTSTEHKTLNVAVIGLTLAARLASSKFNLNIAVTQPPRGPAAGSAGRFVG